MIYHISHDISDVFAMTVDEIYEGIHASFGVEFCLILREFNESYAFDSVLNQRFGVGGESGDGVRRAHEKNGY
ncbi:hypothetical protein HanIR_Chr03g0146851 [Helianthus annuus]|nr:hypothetical protein HanIR_Chr03g0146851 [Helianthus annuus]